MIAAGICSSFKLELLQALHNFRTDVFWVALYGSTADLNVDTTTGYVTDGEVSGQGYTAGGQPLRGVQVLGPSARAAYVTWDDPIWPNSQLIARAALVYNSSSGQRAVAIMDFGADVSSNDGDFWVQFPPPAPSTALVRLL